MRKGLVLALVAGGAAAVRWRSGRQHRDRVDLFFDDGSMVSLDERHEEAVRLLPLAHRLLGVARGAA